MRRLILSLLLAALLVSGLQAYDWFDFEQITVAASSIGFTSTKIAPSGRQQATIAICRLETAQIRFTINTTVPTTTVGTLWESGEERHFNGYDVLFNFRAIRTGATSGSLACTYARE